MASARAGAVLFRDEAVPLDGEVIVEVVAEEAVGEVMLEDEGMSRWLCHERVAVEREEAAYAV